MHNPPHTAKDKMSTIVADYPKLFQHMIFLVSTILADDKIHMYPQLSHRLPEFRKRLATLSRYQPDQYGPNLRQIELVYNRLVSWVKPFYTFDDTTGYTGKIEELLHTIVAMMCAIGSTLHFMKYVELDIEESWPAHVREILREIEEHDWENAQLREFVATFQRGFRAFQDSLRTGVSTRRRAGQKHQRLVRRIQSLCTDQNRYPDDPTVAQNLNALVVLLLCYGSKYNFDVSVVEELDKAYWSS